MEAVLDWLVLVMRTIGSPGVGLATALETVFPPVPSELVLPLAGYTASQGHYSVVAAIVWATGGSLAGALVLYWLGAAWGLERLAALADRIPLMHAEDVRKAVDWFGRHGRAAVFFGRLVPGVRSLVSIPAGVDRMPLWTFCLYTTVGSLLWNSALVLAGFELGEQWHLVEAYVGPASNVVYVLLAIVLVVVAARRLRHRITGERRRSTPPQ
ncbi:membrane protein DedA with SNARE-associated domain [Nocardioides cavernae]|uniref:Membrane protein DedA with SNARE-associated domain n=1 Tax=Nocardioides cavernae TaxID=1921566 RepID=A0A7Y9H5H1_9ACTN|nr:DedA family protein [Nocardioides cavernae]NYE38252.1 membrane protein DedA with SNARE-associated domain [Nocardioides cavernae]